MSLVHFITVHVLRQVFSGYFVCYFMCYFVTPDNGFWITESQGYRINFWFDSCAYLMPFACNSPYGSNSGSVASASTNLTDEIFSSIPATLLFVSLSGCTSKYTSIICLQFSYIPSQIVHLTHSTVPGLRRYVHARRTAAFALAALRGFAATPNKVRCMAGYKKNSEWRGKGKIFKSILWYGSLEELREGS